MSNYKLKQFEPFLTMEIKENLDRYVESKIGKNGEGIAILSYKKMLFESLFPGKNRYIIAIALSAYVDLVRDKWHVEYHKTSNNPYYLMPYKTGQPMDFTRRICPLDFKEIERYLCEKLENQKITLVSEKMLFESGYLLYTSHRQMWLLVNTFFGLHPEYRVLGVITRYHHTTMKNETIYMVTKAREHAEFGDKDIKGLYKYMLYGRVPAEVKENRTPRLALNAIGNSRYVMPIEADILDQMKDTPMTVRELVKQIPNSETLIRIAVKRLYVKGLINIVGRKTGGKGRAPVLFQTNLENDKEIFASRLPNQKQDEESKINSW